MRSLYISLVLALLTWGRVNAVNGWQVNKIFDEANTHFKNENFTEAIIKYGYLIDSLNVINYALWYNSGNSYYRSGQLGKALVAFERAHRLAPRDPEINNNIEFIRFQTKDKIPVKRPFILFRWVRKLYQSFSLGELVWTAEVLYLLIIVLLCIILLKRDRFSRFKHILFTLLAVFILCAAFLGTKTYQSKYTRYAVILDPKVDVYSGPAKKYTLRFILHEGTKLKLHKKSEGWYLIELANSERGWIRQESLEII